MSVTAGEKLKVRRPEKQIHLYFYWKAHILGTDHQETKAQAPLSQQKYGFRAVAINSKTPPDIAQSSTLPAAPPDRLG